MPPRTATHFSVVRRALVWWFRWPGNPYVTVNFSVDFAPAQAWLAGLAQPRVSIGALIAATIARVLHEFPVANARIVGSTIFQPEHVGIAMPVNLLGHAAGGGRELGLALVERAETLSLRGIAAAAGATVKAERTGEVQNAFVRRLLGIAENAPQRVVGATLAALDAASRRPSLAQHVYERFPVTTALSNAGAAFSGVEGMLFRGADIAIPLRLVHIGTFWGVSAIQDEVVAVGGVPTVRPMLPVIFLFDHRLVDGVMGARIASRFGAILHDPAAVFGADGEGLG